MNSKDTICPVCGEHSFEFPDDYDICPNCGWENDGVQRNKKDYWGGANSLSVNEAKAVYSLLQNDATTSKVIDIVNKYRNIQREIHALFRNIDYRTAEGEKCRMAFAQAHKDFISELDKLSEAKSDSKRY